MNQTATHNSIVLSVQLDADTPQGRFVTPTGKHAPANQCTGVTLLSGKKGEMVPVGYDGVVIAATAIEINDSHRGQFVTEVDATGAISTVAATGDALGQIVGTGAAGAMVSVLLK